MKFTHHKFNMISIFFSLLLAASSSARPFDKVAQAILKEIPLQEAQLTKELQEILASYAADQELLHDFDPPETYKKVENHHWDLLNALLTANFPHDINKLNMWQLKVYNILQDKVSIDHDEIQSKSVDKNQSTSHKKDRSPKCPCAPACCALL